MNVDKSDISNMDITQLRALTTDALMAGAERIQTGYNPPILSINTSHLLFAAETHHHVVPEWFLQLKGSSTLSSPEDSIRMHQSDVVIIAPGVPHSEQHAAGGLNIVSKIIDNRLCYHLSSGQAHEPPRRVLGEVIDCHYYHSSASLLTDIAAQRLDPQLLQTFFTMIATEIAQAPAPGGGSAILEQCRTLIEHELHNANLSVGSLAAHFDCHPDHLSRLAKAAWGIPLQPWIVQRRLLRARAMLATPTWSIASIATRCGFNDARYFSRVFHKAYGVAPSAWRQQHIVRTATP